MIPKHKLNYKIDVDKNFSRNSWNRFQSLNSNLNIHFVLSYPRSDMGKGNISGHLSNLLVDSNVLKYDGLLNTNKDLRHINNEEEMDDFKIYKSINKNLSVSESNHLLLGSLLQEFIEDYGEYGHLSFRPHFNKFFLEKLYDKWVCLGIPTNLVIEIGGVITDYEVAPIWPYIINYFFKVLGSSRVHVVLLTECNYNGEDVKTKGIQDAVNQMNSKGISPEFMFVRLPKELNEMKLNDDEVRSYISNKLEDTCNFFIDKSNIGLIPFFSKENLYKYNYLISKTMNIGKKQKIFIGSKNKGKISDWRRYFINLDILDPYMIDKFMEVSESSDSIFENAKKKSLAWGSLTDVITVSDDTGFFIPGLDFKPGVSVKTFGGELDSERTDEEYIKYVYERSMNLSDKTAYFESAVVFSQNGKILKESSYRIEGELNFDFVDMKNINLIEEGYPIGMIWKPRGADKVWSLLDDGEKISYDKSMIESINAAVDEIFNS